MYRVWYLSIAGTLTCRNVSKKSHVQQASFEKNSFFCIFSYSDATHRKCEWAYHIYRAWQINRNIKALGDPTLRHIGDLVDLSDEDMNFAICRFVLEIRKKSGEIYPAETLHEIIICLQLYLMTKGRQVKILDDVKFAQIRNTVDNRMKELSRLGHVKPCKKARLITREEEEMLWNSGILGGDAPKQLVETLLYLFGLHFALHAGAEGR